MSKYLDTQELQPTEPIPIEPLSEVVAELDSSSDSKPVELEFPCSKLAASKVIGVSDVSVGKWAKEIESAGITVTNRKGRITEEGFNLLSQYQRASDRLTFLDNLQSQTPIRIDSSERCTSLTVLEQVRGEAIALQGELVEGQTEYESNISSVTEGLSGLYDLADTLGDAIGDELSDRALQRASQRFNARFQTGIADMAQAMGTRGKK